MTVSGTENNCSACALLELIRRICAAKYSLRRRIVSTQLILVVTWYCPPLVLCPPTIMMQGRGNRFLFYALVNTWPRLAGAVEILSSLGSCVDLTSPSRGRICGSILLQPVRRRTLSLAGTARNSDNAGCVSGSVLQQEAGCSQRQMDRWASGAAVRLCQWQCLQHPPHSQRVSDLFFNSNANLTLAYHALF